MNEQTPRWLTVSVHAPLCRRCVRRISRHVSDVPGVVSLEVAPATGLLRVAGAVDPRRLLAALRRYRRPHGG